MHSLGLISHQLNVQSPAQAHVFEPLVCLPSRTPPDLITECYVTLNCEPDGPSSLRRCLQASQLGAKKITNTVFLTKCPDPRILRYAL